jgi:hypothetical protein
VWGDSSMSIPAWAPVWAPAKDDDGAFVGVEGGSNRFDAASSSLRASANLMPPHTHTRAHTRRSLTHTRAHTRRCPYDTTQALRVPAKTKHVAK